MIDKPLIHCYVAMEKDFGNGPETVWNFECDAESEGDALQQAEAATRLSYNEDCTVGFVWGWAANNPRHHILFGSELFD